MLLSPFLLLLVLFLTAFFLCSPWLILFLTALLLLWLGLGFVVRLPFLVLVLLRVGYNTGPKEQEQNGHKESKGSFHGSTSTHTVR